MKESILREKSIKFSVRIVKLGQFLSENKFYVLANQVLRSGTSIGANINEAQYAQSKADFISKMQIALKEASETEYWLIILYESNLLTEKLYKSMSDDCRELERMLISSINTSRKSTD